MDSSVKQSEPFSTKNGVKGQGGEFSRQYSKKKIGQLIKEKKVQFGKKMDISIKKKY